MKKRPEEPDSMDAGSPEKPQESTDKERMKIIMDLSASLLGKRDIAVEGRAASGVERRWIEDENSFDGMDANNSRRPMLDYAQGAFLPVNTKEQTRSRLIANISRSKCETAWGRFCDIQLPVDAKNWGMKNTPVPELVEGIQDDRQAKLNVTGEPLVKEDGSPARISDIAKNEMDEAKKRMLAMETEIDDQLNECSWNGECRKAAWDAIKLGTGVIKGPNVVKRIKKSWQKQEDETGSVFVVQAIEEFKPELRRVDPWDVYPDPDCGEEIQRAAYIWERDTVLPRELAALIGVDGYLEDQIKMVLAEEPIRTTVNLTPKQQLQISRTVAGMGGFYERWEYNGDVSRDDLKAMGVDCSLSGDDVSMALSACVVFVNDKPIKVVLNPLDTGDLPYDFFQWTTVSGSVWGIGIPRMMYWWDRVLTAAWRAMMDNSADSAGSMLVIGEGIEWGEEGEPRIGGKSLWRANGEIDDIRKAVAQFQVKNNQKELQAVIELTLRFIDMETSLPMLFQGEKESAPDTLGATNIMVDANNVALRGRVKRWDDCITRPALTRMYDYNMQYSPKEEIKGEYNVDACGASVLLARDAQTMALSQAFALKADPDVNAVVDWKKAIRLYFTNQHLDVLKPEEDVKRAEEEAQEAAKQPGAGQDPRVAGQIQVAQMRAQGEMEKAKLVQDSDMREIELKREVEAAGFQFKAQQAELDRQHQMNIKMIEREIKMMELSQASGMQLEDIKAQLTIKSAELRTQKELSGMKTIAAKQVDEPPTEPAQHAPDGRAYQE